METSINIQITDTTLITQLDAIEAAYSCTGETNISSTYANGNVPFIIEASAFEDFNGLMSNSDKVKLDDLITQVANLESRLSLLE